MKIEIITYLSGKDEVLAVRLSRFWQDVSALEIRLSRR